MTESIIQPMEDHLHLLSNVYARDLMQKTAKWGKICSIAGFLFAGLMLAIGLIFILLGNTIIESSDLRLPFPSGYIGIAYLLITLLYFIPSFYLMRYCIFLKKAMIGEDEAKMKKAYSNLKSFFKFFGVFALISIALFVISIIVQVGTALSNA